MTGMPRGRHAASSAWCTAIVGRASGTSSGAPTLTKSFCMSTTTNAGRLNRSMTIADLQGASRRARLRSGAILHRRVRLDHVRREGYMSPMIGRRSPDNSETQPEPHLKAVVEQLEEVLVLVTDLLLEKIREVIAPLDFRNAAQAVHGTDRQIGMTLFEIHRAALGAQTIDTGKESARQRRPNEPAVGQRICPSQTENRNRQLLAEEVFGVALAA